MHQPIQDMVEIKHGGSNTFGSFYSSNNAGRVTTSSSAAKALNPKPNGEWVDFKN